MQLKVLNRTSDTATFYTGKPNLHFHPQPTAIVNLPDNRRLAYDEYGCRTGFPVFYFHDSGSSRLEAEFFHKSSQRQNIRLIALDRPGIGCSDFRRKSSAADFAADVSHLANKLKLGKFGVMSKGSGGVFALTMAFLYADQIEFHLCFAGIPHNVFSDRPKVNESYLDQCLRQLSPPVVQCLIRLRHKFFRTNSASHIQRLHDIFSYADRKTLANPRVLKILETDQQECFRQGSSGVAQDTATGFKKLCFRLEQIEVPVLVWQGASDNLSSRAECEFLASRLPRGSFHRVSNRGHFFFVNCMDDVYHRARSVMADSGHMARL